MPCISVQHHNKYHTVLFTEGESLLAVLQREGFSVNAPCGGKQGQPFLCFAECPRAQQAIRLGQRSQTRYCVLPGMRVDTPRKRSGNSLKLKLNLSKFAGVLFIAFLVTIFVAKMFQILVLMYAGILCAAVGICLADDNQRVGACLLLLPNIRMFDGLSISFLVNILLVLPVIAYILEHRRVNFVALSHCMMFAAWDICHVLFFNQLSRLLPNLSTIVVLYYVECVLIDRSTYICFDDVSRKFAFGCIYSAFVSWIVMSYNFSFEYAWARISAWRLSGYAGDPNYFALYVCISLAMLLSQKYHLKRDYVYVFLLIALALLTTSKMSLIILLVIFLFFAGKALYSFLANRNRFLRRLTVIGIAVAMLFSAQIADLIRTV